MRAGTLKAVVEYVFNGSRFKLHVPSENCHIVFALEALKCPQPSLAQGAISRGNVRAAEPFGDAAKRHARLNVHQRSIEIICNGVTNSGVITGKMFVGGGKQRRDFSLEMIGAGLATVDQRKAEYGEVPKVLIDAQSRAHDNKVGIWSLEQRQETKSSKPIVKAREEMATIKLSKIRSGTHFFFHVAGDEAAKVIEESMQLFTSNKGTKGAPVDLKIGKIVAALFDDGKGKSWYRAKILDKKVGKVKLLFVDHGNVGVVPVATHLRPLDVTLGVDRIPPVAKEAILALTKARGLDEDEGIDAARLLQSIAWGKKITARIFCESEGNLVVALYDPNNQSLSINEQMVPEGLARASKQAEIDELSSKMLNSNNLVNLSAELNVAVEAARKARVGMWRYGDIGDDDEEE